MLVNVVKNPCKKRKHYYTIEAEWFNKKKSHIVNAKHYIPFMVLNVNLNECQ